MRFATTFAWWCAVLVCCVLSASTHAQTSDEPPPELPALVGDVDGSTVVSSIDVHLRLRNYFNEVKTRDMDGNTTIDESDVRQMVIGFLHGLHGDFDRDGVVGAGDLEIQQENHGQTSNVMTFDGDIDMDGIIDNADVALTIARVGIEVDSPMLLQVADDLLAASFFISEGFSPASGGEGDTHLTSVSESWPEEHNGDISANWPNSHYASISETWTPGDHPVFTSRTWPPNHEKAASNLSNPSPHTEVISALYPNYPEGYPGRWPKNHLQAFSATYPPSHHYTVSTVWPPSHQHAITRTWPTPLPGWPSNHKVADSDKWAEPPEPAVPVFPEDHNIWDSIIDILPFIGAS